MPASSASTRFLRAILECQIFTPFNAVGACPWLGHDAKHLLVGDGDEGIETVPLVATMPGYIIVGPSYRTA